MDGRKKPCGGLGFLTRTPGRAAGKGDNMKQIIKRITAVLAVFSLLTVIGTGTLASSLPETFTVTKGQSLTMNYPMRLDSRTDNGALAAEKTGGGAEKYETTLNAFGIFPIKKAEVTVAEPKYVVSCGRLFGLKMFTDGVLVVGLSDIQTDSGTENPAEKAGLREGDVILTINGKEVSTNEEVAAAVQDCGGNPLKLQIQRKNMGFEIEFTPVKSSVSDKYMGGFWVRDSSAGIGTLTFYDPDTGVFAGLGHPICDIDTGEILPLMTGEIVDASLVGVVKGVSGIPGELRGVFVENTNIGTLKTNGETGVYGFSGDSAFQGETVQVAYRQEVKLGEAEILATVVPGEPQRYRCVIEKVNYNDDSPSKNMVIHITDERLLEATGGIVQGMSGSPILQDGKLIGAVTHVFINEPEKGYAIFAENMLKTASETAAQQQEESKAS